MFCPSCGTETNDQTKFCTKCGINLVPVKDAMVRAEPGGASGHQGQQWSDFQKELAAHVVGYKKRTPEEKRLLEIKGGVIVSSVGFGLMIFLGLLFTAIAQTNEGPDKDILLALRFVGIIPLLVGIGILINGLFVSKRIVEAKRHQEQEDSKKQRLFPLASETAPVQQLREPSQIPARDFSVTETTTTKLREPAQVSGSGEN